MKKLTLLLTCFIYVGNLYNTSAAPLRSQLVVGLLDSSNPGLPKGKFNGPIGVIVPDKKGNIYVGGDFTEVDGMVVNRVAKWDGYSWSALGEGLDNYCFDLAIDSKGILYASGQFFYAGGKEVPNLAKWDGESWSGVGEGQENSRGGTYALAVDSKDNLYAGDISPTSSINKWDGQSWSKVVTTSSTICTSQVVDRNDNLYSIYYMSLPTFLSKWDGEHLSYLGSSNVPCYALAVDNNNNLYISQDSIKTSITKWNGKSWTTLAEELSGTCRGFAVDSKNNLYAAGTFSRIDGIEVNGLAMWDGQSWHHMGNEGTLYSYQRSPREPTPIAIDQDDYVYYGNQLPDGLFEIAVLAPPLPNLNEINITVGITVSDAQNIDESLEIHITDGNCTYHRFGTFIFQFTKIKNELARQGYQLQFQETIGNQKLYHFSR